MNPKTGSTYLSSEVGHLSSEVGYLSSEVGHLSSEVGYLSSEVGHLSSEVGNFLLGSDFAGQVSVFGVGAGRHARDAWAF